MLDAVDDREDYKDRSVRAVFNLRRSGNRRSQITLGGEIESDERQIFSLAFYFYALVNASTAVSHVRCLG